MSDVDLLKLPSGQLSWAALVDYVVNLDDRVERYFLEVKSAVDLNTNGGRAKVAKFILGAANRDPARAASRFGGHAVMLLGVGSGSAPGIEPFEAMDLARYVSRIIGADGPGWDFERVPATAGRDVIAVHVAPPSGEIWTCRADGDGLANGDVYVRADGETRKATGDELRVMLQRMKSTAPNVDIEIDLVGVVHAVRVDSYLLEELCEREADRLRLLADPPPNPYGLRIAALSVTHDMRRKADYLADVSGWREDSLHDPHAGVRELVRHLRDGVRVKVVNNATRYLKRVRIEIHFDEPVLALAWEDPEDRKLIKRFPGAPTDWGQETISGMLALTSIQHAGLAPRRIHGVTRVRSEDPAGLMMEMDDLRPSEVFVSDDDEVVLAVIANEAAASTVTASWSMTAEDVNEVFTGVVEIPVEVADWRVPLREWYGVDDPASFNADIEEEHTE